MELITHYNYRTSHDDPAIFELSELFSRLYIVRSIGNLETRTAEEERYAEHVLAKAIKYVKKHGKPGKEPNVIKVKNQSDCLRYNTKTGLLSFNNELTARLDTSYVPTTTEQDVIDVLVAQEPAHELARQQYAAQNMKRPYVRYGPSTTKITSKRLDDALYRLFRRHQHFMYAVVCNAAGVKNKKLWYEKLDKKNYDGYAISFPDILKLLRIQETTDVLTDTGEYWHKDADRINMRYSITPEHLMDTGIMLQLKSIFALQSWIRSIADMFMEYDNNIYPSRNSRIIKIPTAKSLNAAFDEIKEGIPDIDWTTAACYNHNEFAPLMKEAYDSLEFTAINTEDYIPDLQYQTFVDPNDTTFKNMNIGKLKELANVLIETLADLTKGCPMLKDFFAVCNVYTPDVVPFENTQGLFKSQNTNTIDAADIRGAIEYLRTDIEPYAAPACEELADLLERLDDKETDDFLEHFSTLFGEIISHCGGLPEIMMPSQVSFVLLTARRPIVDYINERKAA